VAGAAAINAALDARISADRNTIFNNGCGGRREGGGRGGELGMLLVSKAE